MIKMKPTSFVSALLLSGCLVMGVTPFTQAQQGFTIFGGVKGENELPYYLDFGGKRGGFDRYRLRIPAKKVTLAISDIAVSYRNASYFNGEFDTKAVEVLITKPNWRKVLKKVPVESVNWDKENYVVQVALKEPIPAGSNVEVQLSNVRNPDSGSMFYFDAEIQTPGDVPLLRHMGTWIITIE
jgi:Protein of unknown function (DUF2808)